MIIWFLSIGIFVTSIQALYVIYAIFESCIIVICEITQDDDIIIVKELINLIFDIFYYLIVFILEAFFIIFIELNFYGEIEVGSLNF